MKMEIFGADGAFLLPDQREEERRRETREGERERGKRKLTELNYICHLGTFLYKLDFHRICMASTFFHFYLYHVVDLLFTIETVQMDLYCYYGI
jgi:hypothetical protein